MFNNQTFFYAIIFSLAILEGVGASGHGSKSTEAPKLKGRKVMQC